MTGVIAGIVYLLNQGLVVSLTSLYYNLKTNFIQTKNFIFFVGGKKEKENQN